MYRERVKCPDCHGEGRVPDPNRTIPVALCQRCNGSGRIDVRVTITATPSDGQMPDERLPG